MHPLTAHLYAWHWGFFLHACCFNKICMKALWSCQAESRGLTLTPCGCVCCSLSNNKAVNAIFNSDPTDELITTQLGINNRVSLNVHAEIFMIQLSQCWPFQNPLCTSYFNCQLYIIHFMYKINVIWKALRYIWKSSRTERAKHDSDGMPMMLSQQQVEREREGGGQMVMINVNC